MRPFSQKLKQKKLNNFGIFCLGCAQNEVDSLKINELLSGRGLNYTSLAKANFVIILACSVRQSAIDRIWGKLNLWKNRKKIYIVGCVLATDKQKLEKKYPFLTILATECFFKQIPRLFPKYPPLINLLSCENFENKRHRSRQTPDHAYVPIQFGCDNFCTYCAVPYTRGREKSRPLKNIIQEIIKLIGQSKNHITLLGQNVNSYGLSKKEKQKNIQNLRQLTGDKLLLENEKKSIMHNNTGSFSDLLWKLEKINGLKKLDFLSPNPQDMTSEVINWMATSQKFSGKLNLPLQSGSDKILQKMNRRYSAQQYLALVKKIKRAVPDIELTTDIIVGFPGETKKDFDATFKICQKIKFKNIYIGKYSSRLGTVAEKFFKDDIALKTKKERFEKLNQLPMR